ncbi:MAG: tetratricopeptide repeat protein [Desulfovibrio sp.]|jgi:tetratricopeptide (TPR) repeat protein/GGDEF domain-containing protein|nr:tetratricopeptide repeat protein [Desulfovibrio sp.]
MADGKIHDALAPLPQLTPRDLLEMEEPLCRNMATLFSFTGHALYFPAGATLQAPRLLPRERRLLLPLTAEGRLLGVFMARGVRPREIRPLLSVLPDIAALCLANLALAKAARTDALTSFATEDTLVAHIGRRAARVRGFLEDTAATGGASLPSLCFGLALVRLANGESIVRQTDDYAFENDFLRELARLCADALPPDALPARVGRYEFALLLPGAGRAVCENAVRAVLGRMQAACLPDPLSLRPIRPALCAGYAVYPQDMQGADMMKPMYDQARRLLARALLAADVARDMIWDMDQDTAASRRILAFARILREGGVAREILGGGRVLVSLGRRAGAAEGMRFAVHAREGGAYKGEIVLLQIGPLDSVAEVLHVADAADPPARGDILSPLGAIPDIDPARGRDAAASVMNAQGICGYGAFLKRSVREMSKSARFVLAIVRFEKAGAGVFAEAAQRLRGLALQKSPENGAACSFLCGEYGDTGLIFFHSGASPEAALPFYESLCSALREHGPAAGLAGYPFLHFNKAEIRDCALKALEYALLLPEPRAGACNSLALNISADRLYSQGDLFGAVEEYKLALLADKNNVMALNSLGVCMAALGRREDANRHFLDALKHGGPLEGQTCYNLGAVSQILGRRRAAIHYYRRCLARAPDHLFAHIRLGQLYEAGGRTRLARTFYERAIALEDARQQAGPARRLLAGLMARGRKHGEARELLQDALARNPDDAAAMLGLAKLYLNGNESPELAEMFARRSLGIHDRPEARQTLARALRALNRHEEAGSLEAAAG